jgi:hypothetical protein
MSIAALSRNSSLQYVGIGEVIPRHQGKGYCRRTKIVYCRRTKARRRKCAGGIELLPAHVNNGTPTVYPLNRKHSTVGFGFFYSNLFHLCEYFSFLIDSANTRKRAVDIRRSRGTPLFLVRCFYDPCRTKKRWTTNAHMHMAHNCSVWRATVKSCPGGL